MSNFFSHLGVKTPQYHQASVLHLNGSNFNDLNESTLEEQSQKNVLRSSLLRRRILLATSVLEIIRQFQLVVSYAKYVEKKKASSSPNKSEGNYSSKGAPFSGIVEELRKSVGEVSLKGPCNTYKIHVSLPSKNHSTQPFRSSPSPLPPPLASNDSLL